MEQIRFFLTEYAIEIALVYGTLLLILLLVTLHRIKRIGRQMRRITGERAAHGDREADSPVAVGTGGKKQENIENAKMAEERDTEAPESTAAEKNNQEELLDAVLGEIFP